MWIVIEHQGQRRRVAVALTKQGTWVGLPGRPVCVSARKKQSLSQDTSSDPVLRAPMTAKVVQVQVNKGDSVLKNHTLVVLEAMKMEYQITAPSDAVVQDVQCRVGDLVDLGAVLVVLQR